MSTVGWLLLLVVVAAIGFVVFRRRRPVRRPPGGLPPGGDLSNLGLSEVRVRQDRPATESPNEDRGAEAAAPASRSSAQGGPSARPRPRLADATDGPRARPSGPYVRKGTPLWPDGERSAALLLASLAEHVGGSAAVLSYDAEADAYVVEAQAPAPAQAPAQIPAEACPLHRAPQDRVLTLLEGDELDGLQGIAGGAGAVYARALAEPPAGRAFLVAASRAPDEAAEAGALNRYADLLADLTALAPSTGSHGATDDVAAPASAGGAADSDDAAAVPRADIIREEQEKATRDDRPLAFALVTLADAEALLEGDPAALAEAEAALRVRLRRADGVRRVEPFGDLLFGAFLDLDPAGAADWCDALASGPPPLFIGAVAPADAEAGVVRDAAAEALRDAYVKRRAQVVEA